MRNFDFFIDTKNTFSNYTPWMEIFTSSKHYYYFKSKRQNEEKINMEITVINKNNNNVFSHSHTYYCEQVNVHCYILFGTKT